MINDLFFFAAGVVTAVAVPAVFTFAAGLIAKAKAAYANRKV